MKSYKAAAIFLAMSTFLVACMPGCLAVDSITAVNAVNAAELGLNSVFVAVAEAENAGADVQKLLAQLEIAGDLLSAAYLAFRANNFEAAVSIAEECKKAIAGIRNEADRLRAEADRTKTDTLLLNVFLSSLGLILLLIFSVVGWRALKKRFLGHILEMKPEMGETH